MGGEVRIHPKKLSCDIRTKSNAIAMLEILITHTDPIHITAVRTSLLCFRMAIQKAIAGLPLNARDAVKGCMDPGHGGSTNMDGRVFRSPDRIELLVQIVGMGTGLITDH